MIILVCLITLCFIGFICLPKSKYYFKDIRSLVNEGKAEVIEPNQKIKIDDDYLIIKRIINTEDESYIRYKQVRTTLGWSFSESIFRIFDDNGEEYIKTAISSSTSFWVTEGLILLDKKIKEDVKYLIIKIDWYDRQNKIKIPLNKEGEANENL
ncbi:hypothetical protein LI056_14090 [Clostridium perfringens]|uniref:DUF5643 domain-containing protein n=1 Tax=Clostridium perfringens TaxID=1502 RepID=UPI0022457851|nr:DUF5643 domain-containing protein [Clostridium perfringens]MCX0359118.1 hypothetical protein [Clostridium perfringens]MCX0407921.1 hypothetical protein [Clostridium perfringens]MCX0420139.1 hypothetical protein [Clostridium perfringens]WEV14191.1 hypothetical protein PL326_05840 [Clostridium perfringens D]